MTCLLKKPDGVCCEYVKADHIGTNWQNSGFGWDNFGYCVTEDYNAPASACQLYVGEDEIPPEMV